MGVIRRENVAPAKNFSFDDLERQARQIIESAHERARHVLAEAQREGQRLAEAQARTGYERGLAEGRVAGTEQALREAHAAAAAAARGDIERLTQALKTGLQQFEREKRSVLAAAESGLIELALAVARRVCKTLVQASVEPARANVRALLEMVKHEADLALHVHPEEYEGLCAMGGEFGHAVDGLEHVRVVADPAVARGGCVLHTRNGSIDATVISQLDRIAAALLPGESCAPPPNGSAFVPESAAPAEASIIAGGRT